MDTHEHLRKESEYVQKGPDVLQDLFAHYIQSDLIVAGAPSDAVERLVDGSNPDLAGRFRGIQKAWEKCRFTGYGEAVRLIAKHTYGMDEITVKNIEGARDRNKQLRQPGERLRILKEVGNLDHMQIDDFCWACLPDKSGLDFFLYDLSWHTFCNGEVDLKAVEQEVQIEVQDIRTLGEAMNAIFAKHAGCAIAVKAQHAYDRTLRWEEREEADAERVLRKRVRGEAITEAEKLCLGDWCWARGVELAMEHNLPFKMHTGHYAGHGRMQMERIRSGHLCDLLIKYPQARFVLMHISYPYSDELVAMAKHFPNVYVDLCWAWSIDPFSACDCVRRMIHAVPSNKLFAFGGDTFWPNLSVAFSIQSRQWLTRALQAEVNDGLLTEREAIFLATRLMRGNQEECFDLKGTRAAIASQAKRTGKTSKDI